MTDWDSTSPVSWAVAAGMVRVPLFGSGRRHVPTGNHSMLLDGDDASVALSIGDVRDLIARPEPLSWSWSSNVIHAVLVDQETRRVAVRRWDQPHFLLDLPAINEPRDAVTLIEKLAREAVPTQRTVIDKLLRVFRGIRSIIESSNGRPTDLIRSFNSLLVWADAVRRGLIQEIPSNARLTLRDILPILSNQGLIEFDLSDLSLSGQSFPILQYIDALLEADPDTGLVLDPDLFIRHAAGVLYQEAHIELVRYPWSSATQRMLFVTLDDSAPRGQPQRDAHFTPPSLARALVQEGIAEIRSMRALPDRLKVLDPACGSGVFLIESLREIAATTQSNVSLFGIDRSEVSCIMTEFCLRRSLSDDGEREQMARISRANSLAVSTWDRPDLILMNPPFISWEDMEDDDRQNVSRSLGSHRHARLPDASIAFVARAIDSLKPGAVVATVIPASFLNSSAAENLRAAIQLDRSLSIRLIGLFRGLNYFAGAMVQPALLVIARLPNRLSNSTQDVRFILAEDGHEDEAIRGLRRGDHEGSIETYGWETFRLPLDEIHPTSWLPIARRPAKLLGEMRQSGSKTVAELFDVQLNVQTGSKKVFIVKIDDIPRFAQDPGFNSLFRPIADEIRRGVIEERDFVFFPYDQAGNLLASDDDELARLVPTFFNERLIPNRTRLTIRPGIKGNPWWSLNRPRTEWAIGIPKIVTPQFAKQGNFAYDEAGRFVVTQGNAWSWKAGEFSDPRLPWAYVAILNSPIFEAIIGQSCPRTLGGQYNVNKKYVESVLISSFFNDNGMDESITESLANFGRSFSTGVDVDLDALDREVAAAYRIPLVRMRIALGVKSAVESEAILRSLIDEWRRDTATSSSVRLKTSHPAFHRIVGMGEQSIPIILDQLKKRPSYLFWALSEISGDNAIKPDSIGKVREMIESWLNWGKSRGYEL